jgi:hypothetical protein
MMLTGWLPSDPSPFDKLDDYTIRVVGQELIKNEDLCTLRNFILSCKRFHGICQQLLVSMTPIYVMLSSYCGDSFTPIGTMSQLIEKFKLDPIKIERAGHQIYSYDDYEATLVHWFPLKPPRSLTHFTTIKDTGLYGSAFAMYDDGYYHADVYEFSSIEEGQEYLKKIQEVDSDGNTYPLLMIPGSYDETLNVKFEERLKAKMGEHSSP